MSYIINRVFLKYHSILLGTFHSLHSAFVVKLIILNFFVRWSISFVDIHIFFKTFFAYCIAFSF